MSILVGYGEREEPGGFYFLSETGGSHGLLFSRCHLELMETENKEKTNGTACKREFCSRGMAVSGQPIGKVGQFAAMTLMQVK